MTIIDAQVHIWKPETPDRPYVKEDASKPHRPIPLGYEDLLESMQTAGVDRVILVPPSGRATGTTMHWKRRRNIPIVLP